MLYKFPHMHHTLFWIKHIKIFSIRLKIDKFAARVNISIFSIANYQHYWVIFEGADRIIE